MECIFELNNLFHKAIYSAAKKDLIFDTLAMTISAAPDAAQVTLEALSRIRNELGCHTSLGISNISFGLPDRDAINSTFFTAALSKGLSAAIKAHDKEKGEELVIKHLGRYKVDSELIKAEYPEYFI